MSLGIIALVWFGIAGIDKTIEKTISVDVYEDCDGSYATSSVEISGNIKKNIYLPMSGSSIKADKKPQILDAQRFEVLAEKKGTEEDKVSF